MPAAALSQARRAAGLSQAGLAEAAGISRQAVGAIEAGRHRPSVDAALAIARAVGLPVEDLFGAGEELAEPLAGTPLPDGRPVLAARVGERVVYAPATDALAFEGWPPFNAVLTGGRPRPLPGADLDGLMVMGCDPALGLVASLLPAAGPRRLVAVSGSTAKALEALRDGRVHGALVHNRAGRLPAAPPGTLRLHIARWRVGVANRGARARPLEDLLRSGARIVQREAGASSQRAFVTAAAAHGPTPAGRVAAGHVEVARAVAAGAPAGVTMEPAALQFGLAFGPLEEHVAELWIDGRSRAHPAVEAVAGVLRSSALATRLEVIGGYDLAGCGVERGASR